MAKCNILGNNNKMKNGHILNFLNHKVLPTLSKQQFFHLVHVSTVMSGQDIRQKQDNF